MRSSKLFALALFMIAPAVHAQRGFALERLYPSAPGGGWFVMDDLAMHGTFGGAISVTGGYARDPLLLANGAQSLPVVSDQAFMSIGVAAVYDRFRAYLDLTSPLAIKGTSGSVGPYAFTAPTVDIGSNPDLISDARFGFDVRVLGGAESPFRLGLGAQFFVPNGTRDEYASDETFRAMFRALFAGNISAFTWAAHLGVHLRSQDDWPTPGSPAGPELLFGAAAGARFAVDKAEHAVIVIGPEVYGETALRHFFGPTTGVEGLLTARVETVREDTPHIRVKVGGGAGFDPHFGTPEWRLVFAVEIFAHTHKH